ncbi:MAG: restriction endonuclease subunit S [Vicingaceae bacterium]
MGQFTDTFELHSNGAFKDVFDILHNNDARDIRYIRSENVGEYFIEGNLDYISNYAHNHLPKTKTKLGDILTARTGKVGGASVITDNWINCNSNQNVVNIRIRDVNYINPFYLTVFLNSKFGIIQFEKSSTGNVQPWLNLSLLRKVKVPLLSEQFQLTISSIFNDAHGKNLAYKKNYNDAENFLLQEIQFLDFDESKEAINIKPFSESFKTTGRLDAEYYQPKYEQVMNKITQQRFDSLANIVNITKSIEPGSAYYDVEGLPFMRVADFSKTGLTEPQKFLNDYFVKENKEKIKDLKPKKDTILFSKDGSVGIAYQLRQDFNGITSGAILHLKIRDEKRVIPEYLTLALNSKLVQMQAERDAGGSIILHWRVSEIENVVVPIIDYAKQEKIAELIEESFSLKKQSEHLLEVAKRAVEIAIEENEETAMNYIKNNS